VWAKDGQELFYVDPSVTLTAVPVDTSGPRFSYGNAAKLFELPAIPESLSRDYDVAADGRFLIVKSDVRASRPLVVTLSWLEELKAKVR
jgi:hypothetical protein